MGIEVVYAISFSISFFSFLFSFFSATFFIRKGSIRHFFNMWVLSQVSNNITRQSLHQRSCSNVCAILELQVQIGRYKLQKDNLTQLHSNYLKDTTYIYFLKIC